MTEEMKEDATCCPCSAVSLATRQSLVLLLGHKFDKNCTLRVLPVELLHYVISMVKVDWFPVFVEGGTDQSIRKMQEEFFRRQKRSKAIQSQVTFLRCKTTKTTGQGKNKTSIADGSVVNGHLLGQMNAHLCCATKGCAKTKHLNLDRCCTLKKPKDRNQKKEKNPKEKKPKKTEGSKKGLSSAQMGTVRNAIALLEFNETAKLLHRTMTELELKHKGSSEVPKLQLIPPLKGLYFTNTLRLVVEKVPKETYGTEQDWFDLRNPRELQQLSRTIRNTWHTEAGRKRQVQGIMRRVLFSMVACNKHNIDIMMIHHFHPIQHSLHLCLPGVSRGDKPAGPAIEKDVYREPEIISNLWYFMWDHNYLGAAVGFPLLIAPEVLQGDDDALKESKYDVWAYGELLYALTEGYLPFWHEEVPMYFENILEGKYEFPKSVLSVTVHSSQESRDLIRKCLQKDAKDRPSLSEIQSHSFFAT